MLALPKARPLLDAARDPEGVEFDVVHEDDDIIVVVKSEGLLTVATERERETTAQAYLNAYLKEKGGGRIHVVHRLDRRLAFGVLSIRWVGARPSRILFAFGAVTAFISAWISNTATTAMMFAIGMAILAFLFEQEREGGGRDFKNETHG